MGTLKECKKKPAQQYIVTELLWNTDISLQLYTSTGA